MDLLNKCDNCEELFSKTIICKENKITLYMVIEDASIISYLVQIWDEYMERDWKFHIYY